MLEPNRKVIQEPSARNQYTFALVANLLTIAFGITQGWTSPAVFLLTSNETPLPSGQISMEEASWVASLICVGCLFGNICFGWVTNRFGRKIPLLIITIPIILSALLLIYAQNVYYLYASRLFNGFVGGAGYSIVPLYLAEIASDRVRGIIGSSIVLNENCGILLAFIIGTFYELYIIPAVMIVLILLFGVLLLFFPESPTFLVKQNRIDEADKSIRFYQNLRGGEDDNKLVEIEIAKLKKYISDGETQRSGKKSFELSDLKSKIVRKAMSIGVVLVTLQQFSGVIAMLNYTATIFQEAGSKMSPDKSAIVVGVIQVFSSLVALNLVDRAGRKFLFAVSNFGTAIGLIVLGAYMTLKSGGYPVKAFNWVPLLSFSFVIFVAGLGIITIVIIVLSEIMPEKVKDFAVSMCMSLMWIFSFITIKYLPLLTDFLGFGGSMFLFAGVCLACELFIIFFVPETKGRNHEEIMDSLR